MGFSDIRIFKKATSSTLTLEVDLKNKTTKTIDLKDITLQYELSSSYGKATGPLLTKSIKGKSTLESTHTIETKVIMIDIATLTKEEQNILHDKSKSKSLMMSICLQADLEKMKKLVAQLDEKDATEKLAKVLHYTEKKEFQFAKNNRCAIELKDAAKRRNNPLPKDCFFVY